MNHSIRTPWLRRLAAATSVLILSSVNLRAADEVDPTAALRSQLRDVMLRLRTAETESANAQVARTAAEQKVEALEISVKELTTKSTRLAQLGEEEKAAAGKAIDALKAKVAERDQALVQYNEALEKWKDGYQKAAEVARVKEEERATLASEIIVGKRSIADLERKNIALFNVSNEILDRYEGYALGKALAAREPFIGTTRVKVENLVQGYKDKILDNRISAPAKP